MMANVPIVPAVVINSLEAQRRIGQFWRRPQVIVRFGTPIHFAGNAADREHTQESLEKVMYGMAALLPKEMRGEWQIVGNE